eukprot:g3675.t1
MKVWRDFLQRKSDPLKFIDLLGRFCSILESLKKSAERTQTRQLRRFQQLKKQSENARQREIEWRQEVERKTERAFIRSKELELEALERAHKRELVKERRMKIQEEKEKQRRQNIEYLQEKSQESERRAARLARQKKRMKLKDRSLSNLRQLKRETVKTENDRILEDKRHQMLEKQREIENRISKRKEVRRSNTSNVLKDYERKIQEYQKQLSDIQRRKEILQKAQLQEEERRLAFLAKQRTKELTLERMTQQKHELIRSKSERLKFEEETAKERVRRKQAEDAMAREAKIQSLQEKLSKAERVVQQRELVRNALSDVRREMTRQEEAVKQKLNQLQSTDFDHYQTLNASHLMSSLSRSKKRPKTSRGRMESKKSDVSLTEAGSDYMKRPMSALESNSKIQATREDLVKEDERNEIEIKAKRLKDEMDEVLVRELLHSSSLHDSSDDCTIRSFDDTFSNERKRMIKRLEHLCHDYERKQRLTS